jgi:hypothetical protein
LGGGGGDGLGGGGGFFGTTPHMLAPAGGVAAPEMVASARMRSTGPCELSSL